ncbi:MAG: 4-hydroxyphenylacetate 3-hydroxylase N-terminal domain-containing protein [Actinomycetota bacterium]|nr:4-hydroxyphenylacetate 3-hydroxylase N-terminal domain-containing protein [Actinomycetota bacterium]
MMRRSDEYRECLKAMKPNIYMGGEIMGRDNLPGTEILDLTCEIAFNEEIKHLTTATSHLTGETINRFCHVHQSVDDLLKKQDMTRVASRMVGACIARCMGTDAMNALSVITYMCDQAHGTEYNDHFLKYLRYWQDNDIVGCCAQSDVKGHRRKRPHQQTDPDLYMRVVEKKKDGIVVRGAKAHNSFAPLADEIIAIPTRFLTPEEGDWAVAVAVPGDHPGVKLVCRGARYRDRVSKLAGPLSGKGEIESLTIFDDVFVPWERVFLCGETEFGGQLALLFALYHRHSYTGCKPAMTDVIMGSSALVAEYSGIEREGHVRHKLAELISVAELVYGCGIAASVKSTKSPSGTQVPDVVFCNVARKHAGVNLYHEYDVLADLAGGLPATLPYSEEFVSDEVGDLVKKYLARADGVSPEDLYKCFAWISDYSCSSMAGVLQYAGVHGGGSPVMEDIAILGTYDIDERKDIVKRLAGIGD